MTASMHESGNPSAEPDTLAIDIWLTKLSDITDLLRDKYRELLNTEELERLQRFLVPDARDQFLVARALLRTVLSRYADVPFQEWSFGANAYGKPHVLSPNCGIDLKFNLSHTKGLVACAVNRNYELGVDVENVHRDLDYLRLAPSVFESTEVLTLQHTPHDAQRNYFYSLWTLKEAYIKARGMGLSIPLDAFWFNLEGDTSHIFFSERCPDKALHWQFVRFEPTPDHKLALAVPAGMNRQITTNLHWIVPLI